MLESPTCSACGTEIGPHQLTCPQCRRLIYADRLKALASEAERASSPTEALIAWRSALELLPAGSRQYETISTRIAELGREVDAQPTPPTRSGWKGAAGLGGLALLGWKLKTIVLLVATKGKLLLLGLTKASTFASMALSMGVYWTVYGWRLALGLVISIYIHEMGHVAALMRYGVKASTPLFIPGLGAVIRLQQSMGDPRQDARVGLAGPVWGLCAAACSYLISLLGGGEIFAVIAKFGAWINLFNMLPFGPLDGGRAFRALTRSQRWLALLSISAAWSVTTDPFTESMLTLLLLVGVIFTLVGKPALSPDRGALIAYALLVLALAPLPALIAIPPG